MRKAADAGRERATAAREAMGERIDAAREATNERMETAREATAMKLENAKEVTGERVEAVKLAASELQEKVKPKLRGVIHEGAFPVSLVAGAILVIAATGGRERLALAVYAVSLSALLGTSALYHRVDWKRPETRLWMRRLDHSMIFLLIAGTYTPFALVVFEGALAQAILVAVWAGAAAGLVLNLLWIDAPKWVAAIVYLVLGWVGVLAFPQMLERGGVAVFVLVVVGGGLYSLGAVAYATHRPNPAPGVLGYHEVFHLLTIGAAAAQYAAVSLAVL